MDRGRVGYDLVANKTIRENALRNKRNCHLERLKKIKNREPGSSNTLDNTLPGSLANQMIAKNPRKKKIKEDYAVTIQRENRALLQRISLILTAPPKITEEDYLRMKKLATRDKVREKFEKSLSEKRNEEIFRRIKSTPAYYHHKDWEDDYVKQKEGQKFMRQVRYERPKDFVDPFAPPPKVDDDEKDMEDIDIDAILENDKERQKGSAPSTASTVKKRGSGGKGGGHVNSVRSLKEKSRSGPQRPIVAAESRIKSSPGKLQRAGKESEHDLEFEEDCAEDREHEGQLCDEAQAVNKSAPMLLAHVHRHTPLVDGRAEVDKKLPNTNVLADIQCWRKTVQSDEIRRERVAVAIDQELDDNDSVDSASRPQHEKKREPRHPVSIITVRAEILDFSQREYMLLLSVDRLLESWAASGKDATDLPVRSMKSMEKEEKKGPDDFDERLLKAIASEIAASVTLVVENSTNLLSREETVMRIDLPKMFASAEVYKREPKKGLDLTLDSSLRDREPSSAMSRLMSYDSAIEDGDQTPNYEALAEVNKKIVMSAGCRVPFELSPTQMAASSSQSIPHGGASSGFVQRQLTNNFTRTSVEKVHCLLKLKELGDEKVRVSIIVLADFTSEALMQQHQRVTSSRKKSVAGSVTIAANSSFTMPLALPSIMALDADLVKEFFGNIVANVRLFYDRSTDTIALTLKE